MKTHCVCALILRLYRAGCVVLASWAGWLAGVRAFIVCAEHPKIRKHARARTHALTHSLHVAASSQTYARAHLYYLRPASVLECVCVCTHEYYIYNTHAHRRTQRDTTDATTAQPRSTHARRTKRTRETAREIIAQATCAPRSVHRSTSRCLLHAKIWCRRNSSRPSVDQLPRGQQRSDASSPPLSSQSRHRVFGRCAARRPRSSMLSVLSTTSPTVDVGVR